MSGNHNKIGGKSVVDEAVTGLVTKAVLTMLNSVEHKESVQKMLRSMPPVASLVMDPVLLQAALSAMPDFGHPEIAHMVKDVLVQSAHAIEDMVHDAKHTSPEDRAEAGIKAGIKASADTKYAVQGRCFHRLECGEIPAPRQQHSGKKGEPPRARNDFRELTLSEAIRQRYFPCQFCIGGAKEAKLPHEAPPAARKLEPLEIIAACTDEQAKGFFSTLIKTVSAEEKVKIFEALKHLDSETEFLGAMGIAAQLKPEEYSGFVAQLGTMLGGDASVNADTRGFFSQIGNVVGSGSMLALDLVKDVWNAKVDAQTRVAGPSPRDTPAKRSRFGIIRAFTV